MGPRTCLWIVVPCYNEAGSEGALSLMGPLFLRELRSLISDGVVSDQSKILFVDDGSTDSTWDIIEAFANNNSHVAGIRLSRNRGHQNALLAGLMEAKDHCDIAITIDCDGQDDLSIMVDMIEAYRQGSDVVYGVRAQRTSDGFLKRSSAEQFYKLLENLGAEVVFNHADYRLMSKRSLEGLAEFDEVNLYLRGLVPLVGFPSSTVEYERAERVAGESHYSIRKMFALALDGITSLSVKPIRFISALGIVFSLVGLVGIIWALITVILGQAVAGWASTICVLCLLGGLQLLCLGVIGEYIGKIYLETKKRPRYLISDRIGLNENAGQF